MRELICDAISRQLVLELRYHQYSRLVEPYAHGVSRVGDELLRCYQVAGGSVGGERRGWKLLRIGEIVSVHATQTSFEPRLQYNPNDPGMAQIFCRID